MEPADGPADPVQDIQPVQADDEPVLSDEEPIHSDEEPAADDDAPEVAAEEEAPVTAAAKKERTDALIIVHFNPQYIKAPNTCCPWTIHTVKGCHAVTAALHLSYPHDSALICLVR